MTPFPAPERRPPATSHVRAAGFTLMELLTALAVGSMLFAVGIPSYKYITNRNRVAAEINSLLGDLQFARAEAIKEGQDVTVCQSSDGTTCTGSTSWDRGWVVFSDPNQNQLTDFGETRFRTQSAFTGSDTLVASLTTGGAGPTAVTFSREGFLTLGPGVASIFTLHTTPANTAYARCLLVSVVGQLTVELTGTGTCL
jgi:type IV fimbrial biogenesis protein FimT